MLNKKGKKDLRNVLKHFNDPLTIKNASQKTRVNTVEKRARIIVNSFRNLTDEDKVILIEFIKDKPAMLKEFILAFSNFVRLDQKKEISDFLVMLMEKIQEENIRLEVYGVIFKNDAIRALSILSKAEPEEYQLKLHTACAALNPEKGYIYGLLNNINQATPSNFNMESLLKEINHIQPFHDEPILEKIMTNLEDLEELVNEIKKKIKQGDFATHYTLSRNLDLLSRYDFCILKDEIKLLDELMRKLDSDENLSQHSYEWLIFLIDNFLKMDIKMQGVAIKLLNYIIEDKVTEDNKDKLADMISRYILENREIRNELFRLLGKLNTTKGFYNIINMIDTVGFRILKDSNFTDYINTKLDITKEFKWLAEVVSSGEYVEPHTTLNDKVLMFILKDKTPKENYDILAMLKQNNNNLYIQLMISFVEIIDKKFDRSDKYTKLLIVLEYSYDNTKVSKVLNQYAQEHRKEMKYFREVLDPNLLEQYYLQEIKKTIKGEEYSNIIKWFAEIKDPVIKRKASSLTVEMLEDNHFNELIGIWEHLEFDTVSESKLRRRFVNRISKKEVPLTKETIHFGNKIGIESTLLFSLINDNMQKEYLLDAWYHLGQIGKIIGIIKDKIINKVGSLQEMNDIIKQLEKYEIRDQTLMSLIKIKTYSIISMQFLEIEMTKEEAPSLLDELADMLELYNLTDRFLDDKLLHKEAETIAVDYIARQLMKNDKSDAVLEYYWVNMISDFNNGRHTSFMQGADVFFTHLVKSKNKIEWLLDKIETDKIPINMHEAILEKTLNLLNKNNRIILQIEQEKENQKEDLLNRIANNICNSLSNIEKIIINRTEDLNNDILVVNLKKLRYALQEIGIVTAEEIENYGQIVNFDINKHDKQLLDNERGRVDSLGIGVNNKDILPSTLLNID